MAFELKQTSELVSIAAAGGGFDINVSLRPTPDLVAIAGAAKRGNARLIFRGLHLRQHSELVSIASAGGGAVTFADRKED
jgi:hypothetical protein